MVVSLERKNFFALVSVMENALLSCWSLYGRRSPDVGGQCLEKCPVMLVVTVRNNAPLCWWSVLGRYENSKKGLAPGNRDVYGGGNKTLYLFIDLMLP